MTAPFDAELLAHATPEELVAYKEALEIELALESPLDYACYTSGSARPPHIELLNDWIMALIEGRLYFDGPGPAPVWSGETYVDGDHVFKVMVHPDRGDRPVYNLAISMPPRHGKSYLVSQHLPAWFQTLFPDFSTILASYEADFAAEWGAKARDLIVDHPELGAKVRGGRSAAKSLWHVDGHPGQMKTGGAGGPLTGSGGHLMICDDPVKNQEEALSEVERQSKDDWWSTTFYTRREPWVDTQTPGRVILMNTRWHEDDIQGRKVPETPEAGDGWAKINLPALWEPAGDEVCPLGREPGQALWPQRVPAHELMDIRKPENSGEIWFQALYQGNPFVAEGNVIKAPFRHWSMTNGVYTLTFPDGSTELHDEKQCYRFATMDLAATKNTWSDYTVFTVFDVTRSLPRRLIVRHVERLKMETEDHEKWTRRLAAKWQPRFVSVEDKTFGTNLINRMIRKGGVTIRKVKADKDKTTRALPIDTTNQNDQLFLPAAAAFRNVLEKEMLKFPNGKHDDMVDTIAYGVEEFEKLPAYKTKPEVDQSLEAKLERHIEKKAKQQKKARRARVRRPW